MGSVHVSLSDYGRKTANDVNVEIHEEKFKADFVVLDYVNEGESSILNSTNLYHFTITDIPSPNPKAKGEHERGKERLNKKEFSEEDKVGIFEHGLPKKMCDPKNYVLLVKINGVVEMVALVDTEASVSVLPYSLYKDLEPGDLRPYQTNLTMADRSKKCTLCIDDEVILHTYFPKPRSKSCVEDFEIEGEDDWLGSFEVGRDEDGNMKYGLVAPSFIDIEDDMERALAMEA
ncbi:hypothetical protein Tco_1486765 [Tanacetum coccineum]